MISEWVRFDQFTVRTMYSERQALANSVDPDQTPQTAASDQGLLYLPVAWQFLTHLLAVK